MNNSFETTHRFWIFQTWANWDTVKHQEVATAATREDAEYQAAMLSAHMAPWSVFYVKAFP